MIRLVFIKVFVPCFIMLILSIAFLEMDSKSTSSSRRICVCRPNQYKKICWKLDLIYGFFAFSLLIVLADIINKCGWFLARGRRCWLKGLYRMPSVSWICHHSLLLHIFWIVSILPVIPFPLYCYWKWWVEWLGGWWLIYIRVLFGKRGDKNLTTHFYKILTFPIARGFYFVLSLGATTPLITPVMGINWILTKIILICQRA